MVRSNRVCPDSPEVPRTGELRERGEIRRLCLAGAATADQARWIYEGETIRVRVAGGAELRGVVRELEPGVLKVAGGAGVRRVFLGEISEIEILPTPATGVSGG